MRTYVYEIIAMKLCAVVGRTSGYARYGLGVPGPVSIPFLDALNRCVQCAWSDNKIENQIFSIDKNASESFWRTVGSGDEGPVEYGRAYLGDSTIPVI